MNRENIRLKAKEEIKSEFKEKPMMQALIFDKPKPVNKINDVKEVIALKQNKDVMESINT